MKRLFVALTLIAVAFLVATPASAFFFGSSPDVTVNNSNSAFICNDVEADADTGDNEIEGRRSGMIITGPAYADALVNNTVNSNRTRVNAPCEGCEGDVVVNNSNSAFVANDVEAEADTGDNEIEDGRGGCRRGGGSGCGLIITGSATAYSTAVNVVNSNVTRIRR